MKKILIIEDDKILLETATDFLSEEGFEVYRALEGSEGIRLAETILPDLILCDIYMPGIDGYQVFARLQSGMETSRIPFIFMTAKAEKEDIRFGMQMGADDYITKPVNFLELIKSIQTRIEKFEKTIKKSEAKYHALFELAGDSIIMVRPGNGEIFDANISGLDMLGYTKEELLNHGYDKIASDEILQTIQSWKTGKAFDKILMKETSWLHRQGFEIPVQVNGTILEIAGESFFLLIARNIADIRAKENALQESEERYRNLIENTGEGVGVVDENECFTYVNPAACDIFGLPSGQMMGRSLQSFMDEMSFAEMQRQTENRKQGEKGMYEMEVHRPDGSNRWIIVTATPSLDSQGKFTGTSGIFRDITHRKLAENKLEASEKRLSEIVDLTNDWIWEIDPEWKYTYVSPKVYDSMGYSPEEMIGKTPFDFMITEDIIKTKENLRSFVHQYKPLTALENRAKHKNGQVIYLETSGIPMLDEKGKYSGYRGADRDITLRKLYEKELIFSKEKAEESDRLKSSILANMSHELRTPLNGILGFAEILKEELRDTEYESMAENIRGSGKRLMSTLNSIITLSQLEAGKVSLSMKEVDLKVSIDSVIKSMELLATEKNIYLRTSGIEAIAIVTDDHLIKQLMRQLLDNAIKFTDGGGITVEYHIVSEGGKDWAVLKVSDTGIGIEKDYFDIIFQEFRQVSEGFGRRYQGSGIGLTICKKIIDLLGGHITLESSPGKGSSFFVWLPVNKHEKYVSEKNLSTDKKNPLSNNKLNSGKELPLILLVEDNLVNKDLTEYFLRAKYRVDHAPDGATALEMVKTRLYAALLMDINLGFGMTGIEVTREIRKLAGYESIPIVAVTGYTLEEDKEKLMEIGCTHYIAKPFDQSEILALLDRALHQKA